MSVLTKDEMELIREDLECIKTLPNPPKAIQVTLEAVALLLGYPPRQARNWSFMRQLCNRGPLLKKMQEFQCEDVELASAKRARTLLSSYNRETIIKISVAIVNLFNWAESTMSEVDNYLNTRMELNKARKSSNNRNNNWMLTNTDYFWHYLQAISNYSSHSDYLKFRCLDQCLFLHVLYRFIHGPEVAAKIHLPIGNCCRSHYVYSLC